MCLPYFICTRAIKPFSWCAGNENKRRLLCCLPALPCGCWASKFYWFCGESGKHSDRTQRPYYRYNILPFLTPPNRSLAVFGIVRLYVTSQRQLLYHMFFQIARVFLIFLRIFSVFLSIGTNFFQKSGIQPT